MNRLITISYKDSLPDGYREINCTSRGFDEYRLLSPFMNRQVYTCDGLMAENVENLWQFSKVYPEHVRNDGKIKDTYYLWRNKGFADTHAHRYPMGKGAVPLFSLWGNQRLDYIEARKQIYFPVYSQSVEDTDIYKKLLNLYKSGAKIAIRDFDVYRFDKKGMTIDDVINDPNQKAGHGFVLYKMLINSRNSLKFE